MDSYVVFVVENNATFNNCQTWLCIYYSTFIDYKISRINEKKEQNLNNWQYHIHIYAYQNKVN